jgi:hypothetical protein
METTQGLSLYTYLYFKLIKMPCFFIIIYIFSSTKPKIRRQNRFCLEREVIWGLGLGGNVAQIMYAHVSKYKNDTC